MLHVQNLELDRQSPLLFLTLVTVRSSKILTTTFCLICLHLRKSWTWHLVYRIIMKVKLSMSSNLKWIEVKNHHSNSKATTKKNLALWKLNSLYQIQKTEKLTIVPKVEIEKQIQRMTYYLSWNPLLPKAFMEIGAKVKKKTCL